MTKYGERLLKSQGWRGKGHTLHPTDNAIGLSNPLRISRNTDGRGIGGSTHYTSDQWWLAAFDEKLKGLDTSKTGQVTQTTTQSKLDAVTANIGGGKYTGAGGLYASFVRGEGLAGTVSDDSEQSGRSTPTDREDVAGLKGGVSRRKEEKRREKEEKKRRKAMEKMKKKEEKKAAKKAARKEEKEEEKKRRKDGGETKETKETKEERKARKMERRAKKEEKRRRAQEKEKKETKG